MTEEAKITKAYKKYAAKLVPAESKRIGGSRGIIRRGERDALEAERRMEIDSISKELMEQQKMGLLYIL